MHAHRRNSLAEEATCDSFDAAGLQDEDMRKTQGPARPCQVRASSTVGPEMQGGRLIHKYEIIGDYVR